MIGLAARFYQQLLRAQTGAALPDDPELRQFIQTALARPSGDALAVAARLDRCLDALEQIDRNANQTTLIEAWLDALAAE